MKTLRDDLYWSRTYRIPCSRTDESEDFYQHLGWTEASPKSLTDVEESICKAGRAEYEQVHLYSVKFSGELIEACRKRASAWGLRLIVSLPLIFDGEEHLERFESLGVYFRFLVPSIEPFYLEKAISRCESTAVAFDFLIGRYDKSEEFYKRVPPIVLERAGFVFYDRFFGPAGLDEKGVAQWIRKIQELSGKKPPFRLVGEDAYDPRITDERDLEPELPPVFEMRSESPDIQISVIIPSYNNIGYLKHVVAQVLNQSLDRNQFELIVVDDGGSDSTTEILRKQIEGLGHSFNVKLFFFPRTVDRKMGDDHFRAGVARNLGVKNATGEVLLFLDSDIVLPHGYLHHLVHLHEDFDVVLPHRLQLTEERSHSFTGYDSVRPDNDVYRSSTGYWEKFQETRQPWGEREKPWKYVSTYCLSVKRPLFAKAGAFRKVFTSYGFEDTDLGFRLHHLGVSYKISPLKVYHFYHEVKRSEYARSEQQRQRVLARTAKIFYRQYLDDEIYSEFKHYINSYRFFGLELVGSVSTARQIYSKFQSVWHRMEMAYWKSFHPRLCDTYEALKNRTYLK